MVQRRLDEKSVLYNKVLDIRNAFDGVIGEGESSKQVGLDAGLAQVASPLLRRYAKRALVKLEAPDFKPSPKVPGAKLEPQETADDLRPALKRFETALKQLAQQRRVTQEAQRVRQEALDDLHFVTFNGSRMVASHYTIAGERFHAERIRQNLGGSTGRKKPEGGAETGGNAPGARQPGARQPGARQTEEPASADADVPQVTPPDPPTGAPQPGAPQAASDKTGG